LGLSRVCKLLEAFDLEVWLQASIVFAASVALQFIYYYSPSAAYQVLA
jgi:hypothetical protein